MPPTDFRIRRRMIAGAFRLPFFRILAFSQENEKEYPECHCRYGQSDERAAPSQRCGQPCGHERAEKEAGGAAYLVKSQYAPPVSAIRDLRDKRRGGGVVTAAGDAHQYEKHEEQEVV